MELFVLQNTLYIYVVVKQHIKKKLVERVNLGHGSL